MSLSKPTLKALNTDKECESDGAEVVNPSCPTVEIAFDADDEHALTAFGDISLSTINFVPGPPSALSPARKPQQESKSGDVVPLPTITRKVLPPGPSKAGLRRTEPTFEVLVKDLQRSRGKSKSSDVPAALHPPHSSLLADLQNFGPQAVIARVDAVIGNVGSHEGVENNAPPKTPVTAKACADVPDENGTSPVGTVNKPKKSVLRGNAKLPKRLPIPRWVFDNDSVNHEGHGRRPLGLSGQGHLFLS